MGGYRSINLEMSPCAGVLEIGSDFGGETLRRKREKRQGKKENSGSKKRKTGRKRRKSTSLD